MKKRLWLWMREKTVQRMLLMGLGPDKVLEGSTILLTDGKGGVESPVYYDAVRWVIREKFSGVSDAELLDLTGRASRGKSLEVTLAMLEIIRRKEKE